MNKKKLLHVFNVPFGLPYFLGDQINYLKELDFDISIACSGDIGLNEFVDKYDVKKFEVEVIRKIDLITDLKSVIKLVKYIKKEKFDYVVGHTPKGALIAMIASWVCGVQNRIYFRHGLVFETSNGFKRKMLMFLEKLTSRLATKIVCVSQSIKDVSIEHNFGRLEKNILLNKGTCNGVNVNKYTRSSKNIRSELGITQNDFVLGFVGRLVKDKGVAELIQAWELIKEEFENVVLLLVGPLEERDALRLNTVEMIKQDKSIVVTGFVTEAQPYYNIMDVFILPSYREGFPTVVLEASSMELPIITSKATGCIDSILDNQTGVYCDITAVDIKEKIKYYIENKDIRVRHGENGRKWIDNNFRQEIIWKEISEKIYNVQ